MEVVKSIDALTPLAQTACRMFLNACSAEGIRLFLTETYRSQQRQDELYEQGRSKPGKIVTWTHNSRHTSRRAWDVACSPPAKLYDEAILKRAGKVAARLGIVWGGTWKTPDTPHFEINTDWKAPKEEEEDMEKIQQLQTQVNELRQELDQVKNKMIYNYIDQNMPQWARPTIQKLVDKGILKGNEQGELGLDDDLLRMLVINDRAGIYGQ